METNKTKLTIEQIRGVRGLPLYSEAGGQESKAYLALDTRDGEVYTFEQAAHDNTMTQAEAHGHVRTYRIPNNLTAPGLSALLADKTLRELLRTIYHGRAERCYDGNFRTILSDDAAQAEDEARAFCEGIEPGDYGSLEPWCAAAWLELSSYKDLVVLGCDHVQAAEKIVAEAEGLGAYLSALDVKLRLDEMKERLAGNSNSEAGRR